MRTHLLWTVLLVVLSCPASPLRAREPAEAQRAFETAPASVSPRIHRPSDLDACSPAPALKAALDRLPYDRGPDQSGPQFREQKLAAIVALQRRYPGDLFVERALIEFQADTPDQDGLIDHYKTLREQSPDDARLAYLTALTLAGRRTPEAIMLLEAALDKAPKFPWPHLALADIYTSPVFSNKEKAVLHITSFLALCPSAPEGYSRLARIDDPGRLQDGARKLRALLHHRRDPDAVGAYSTLWSLEFKARPPAEYDALRLQIFTDMKHIRSLKLKDSRQWYRSLAEGYRLLNDEKGSDRVTQERQRRFPNAFYPTARVKWMKDHPDPKPEDPPEAKRVYYSALLKETDRWLQERPNASNIWMSRLDAIEYLDDVPASKIEAAAEGAVKAAQADAGPWGPEAGIFLFAAEILSRKAIHPERVVDLARQGLTQLEVDSRVPANDLYVRKEMTDRDNFDRAYERARGLALETDGHLKLGQAGEGRLELAQLDERVQALRSLAGANKEFQKTCSGQEASYWGLAARLAKLESRKLDAMAFYENALLTRLEGRAGPEAGERDELADDARNLWDELGGTEEGWQAWYGRRAAALAGTPRLTWEEAHDLLPPFDLADFGGKTWGLADLKGKVTLLNFWASW